MITIATYNDVTFYNVVTREFDEEILYDASNTDYIGSRFKLRIEGEIHVQQDVQSGSVVFKHGIQTDNGPVNNSSGNTAAAFKWLQRKLGVPRKTFTLFWSTNGITPAANDLVIVAKPAVADVAPDADTDCENGPHPRGLSVLRVTGKSIRVQFSIEFFLSGCPQSQGQMTGPYRIINNRWSIHESMDADFFTTRRIAGLIKFSEGLTHKHAFKVATVPGLEKGFRRVSIEYESAASGLEATYAVTDEQVHTSAPWPATSMEVSHSYSSNDGLTWLDQCDVTLHGSPAADRKLLLQRMIQIMDARCEGLRVINDNDKQYMLENVIITEHFGKQNFVSGSLVVKHFGESTRVTLGNILEKHLGKPLELPVGGDGAVYDRTISQAPSVYGYDSQGKERSPAYLFLLNCYQQDPCSPVKRIFGGSVQSQAEAKEPDKESSPYPVEVPKGTLALGSTSSYDPTQFVAAYITARLSNEYVTNRLRVMMPVAAETDEDDTAIPVDLASGVTLRIIHYEAERIGDFPDIPQVADTYVDGNIRGYLLKAIIRPQPPALAPDGHKRIFRVTATICYGLNRMVREEKLACGKLPYTSFKSDDTRFDLKQKNNNKLLV